MNAVKVDIEGLSVEVSHADINGRLKIRCKGCGRRDIKVTNEDIKEAGAHATSEERNVPSVFNAIKITHGLSKKLVPILTDKSLDFINFLERFHIWKKEKDNPYNIEVGLMHSAETSITKTCELCQSKHTFNVVICNPIEVPFDLPNLVKEFSDRGINKNSRNMDILTRVSYRPYAGDFENAETFLLNVEAVNEDTKMVRQFTQSVIKSLDAYTFKSELGNTWIEDLKTSLTEVSNVLMGNLNERLLRDLNAINHEIESIAGVIEY